VSCCRRIFLLLPYLVAYRSRFILAHARSCVGFRFFTAWKLETCLLQLFLETRNTAINGVGLVCFSDCPNWFLQSYPGDHSWKNDPSNAELIDDVLMSKSRYPIIEDTVDATEISCQNTMRWGHDCSGQVMTNEYKNKMSPLLSNSTIY
jgi:hypothetical protein